MRPPAVTIAADIVRERLRNEFPLTIEAAEDAVEAVYKLWESRGLFSCQCERETISEFTAPMVRILRDSATTIDRRTEAGL